MLRLKLKLIDILVKLIVRLEGRNEDGFIIALTNGNFWFEPVGKTDCSYRLDTVIKDAKVNKLDITKVSKKKQIAYISLIGR